MDWDNLAEEIDTVGRNELRAVISHLRLALLHDLMAEAWPLSRDVDQWRAEAQIQRQQARDAYTLSMAQLDVEKIYRQARRDLPRRPRRRRPQANLPEVVDRFEPED